ncbi:hypothetical protein BTO20_36300 [Mycobacterium dioxanotrophicus]|uniref:AbrB family transcriptional regulator n=1 Tax=Mycobacterium dioxanotrophicus TaxID=482462 RepID=A0A1Y0CGL6_9MYCO|nr:hypothetical protein BTO20_36300 [Mycobacterium dioxanotrophicus]
MKLPTKLAKSLHLKPGDEFYWRHSDDDPDILLFVPAEVLERRYTHGEHAERAVRTSADPLPNSEEQTAHDQRPSG